MDKSQMRIRPGFLLGLFIVFIFIPYFLSFLLQPTSGKSRGNKFAMFVCGRDIDIWQSVKSNRDNFDFYKLANEDKRRVIVMGYKPIFLIKTNFVWGSISNREIVIVCKSEFDNVPEPAFWNFYHRNPAHAVGYSDGTTGLISPEQFTNLNLSGFVSLQDLATNSEFGIFKP